MKKAALAVFSSMLLSLAPVCYALDLTPNLVVNGGFESGISGWFGTYGIYLNSPNTVDGTCVGQLLDIGSSSVHRTLSQTLATTPGATYDVHFALRLPELGRNGYPVVGDSRGGTTTITVNWNDLSLDSIPVVNRDTWSFYDIQVRADRTSTVLNFYNPSMAAWPFIDGVSVTEVPEPGAWELGVPGFLVFVVLRHFYALRRRNQGC